MLARGSDLLLRGQLFAVTLRQCSSLAPAGFEKAYRNLCSRLPEAMPAPVHNEVFGVAQHGNKYAPIGSGTVIVRFPLLASNVRKYVERPPFSFANSESAAVLDADDYIELHHWLRRIYREFRELDQRILLTDLNSDAARTVMKR